MTHHSRASTVTFDDSLALHVRRRVTSVNSLSVVEYLFEVHVPVIVYHGGDVVTQRTSVRPLIQNLSSVPESHRAHVLKMGQDSFGGHMGFRNIEYLIHRIFNNNNK